MKDTPLDRIRHAYGDTSFQDLLAVQAVWIEDYRRLRAEGEDNRAECLLADINNIGKLIEERE